MQSKDRLSSFIVLQKLLSEDLAKCDDASLGGPVIHSCGGMRSMRRDIFVS